MLDCIIIGQGLAGTALAWQLVWRGASVLILDREAAVTSSRVAAGLITPITGKRLAKTPRLDEHFPAAIEFYRRVEAETGVLAYHPRRVVRLFISTEEQTVYVNRQHTEFLGWVSLIAPTLDDAIYTAPLGCYEMSPAGQLMTTTYLDASREWFRNRGMYGFANIDVNTDLAPGMDAIRLPALGLAAKQLVICEGYPTLANKWFPEVRFEAAKGEILTLRIPGLVEDRIINRGGTWLAPIDGGLYRAGSTYDRDNLDSLPTLAGREEILRKLASFLRLPIEVVDHQAGVRPITAERMPVTRRHPQFPRLGYFNGLHSKGSLLAPLTAKEFVAAQFM